MKRLLLLVAIISLKASAVMGQSLYKKGDVIDVKPCKLSVEAAHRELLVLAVANSNYVPLAEARANDPQYFLNDKYLWNIDYSKIRRPSRPDVRQIVDDVLGEYVPLMKLFDSSRASLMVVMQSDSLGRLRNVSIWLRAPSAMYEAIPPHIYSKLLSKLSEFSFEIPAEYRAIEDFHIRYSYKLKDFQIGLPMYDYTADSVIDCKPMRLKVAKAGDDRLECQKADPRFNPLPKEKERTYSENLEYGCWEVWIDLSRFVYPSKDAVKKQLVKHFSEYLPQLKAAEGNYPMIHVSVQTDVEGCFENVEVGFYVSPLIYRMIPPHNISKFAKWFASQKYVIPQEYKDIYPHFFHYFFKAEEL